MRCVDLFAGIGGIRLGFEQAFPRLMTVLVSEWDPRARETYRTNFRFPAEILGDVREIPVSAVPEFDILLAGFPCQAFSIAGHRMGFQDSYRGISRGTLFAEAVRFAAAGRPKVVFCENVKGLVSHDHGRTSRSSLVLFRNWATGFSGRFSIQRILAFRRIGNEFTSSASAKILHLRSLIFRRGGGRVCLRDILEKDPVPSKYWLSSVALASLKRHRERNRAKGNGFGYEIRSLDGIAGALVCGGMGRERNLIVDRSPHLRILPSGRKTNVEDVRKLTPREWARLQGFPDSFVLPCADTHSYHQLGNSVTVPVIRAVALKIREALEG